MNALEILLERNPLDKLVCEDAGAVVGNDKLLQKIGEGGFGTVQRAEQFAPVKRRVAPQDHQTGHGYQAGGRRLLKWNAKRRP